MARGTKYYTHYCGNCLKTMKQVLDEEKGTLTCPKCSKVLLYCPSRGKKRTRRTYRDGKEPRGK